MPAGVPREDHRAGGWREIRHYAYVERPFDDVWALLARSAAEVLSGGSEASGTPETSLHVKRAGVEMSRAVRLRFGGLVCDERRARLSLRWEDAHHPRLFPVLEAVLELAPLKSGRCQITQIGVVGRYRPPFGTMGGLADSLAGETVAAESVARFVEDLARRVEALIAEPPAPGEDLNLTGPPVDSRLRRVFMPVDRLDDRPGGAACVGRYLETAPGVVRAEVHPLVGMATIEFDPELCSPVKLLQDLEDDREWFRDGPEPDQARTPGSDV
jgi:hypothetical protein